jgi:hypothetical protein
MDELLEVVSEAVSAMVLYTVEADERNTRVVDISQGAAVVKTAADYFVDMASKAAEFWVNFNRADMRDKMLATGSEVKQATADILQASETLAKDPFSKPGKKLLLKGAKNTMAHLVVLLQQADLYEVTRIIRACNRVSSKKAVVVSLPPGESYFAAGAQELVTHTVDLAKAITKRIKEIDDFTLKRRFEDASTNLRTKIDVFLKAMANVMRSEPGAPQEAQLLSADLDEIIEEVITVTKLSAKSPFDLSMIEGLDLKDDEDLQDLAMLVKNNLNRLQRAIDMGDGKEANGILNAVRKGLNDLIALNRALAKNCEDPVLKARYDAAAAAAQKTLDEVIPTLADEIDKLLRQPNSTAAWSRLNNLVDELSRATHGMVMASSAPNTEDLDLLVTNLTEPLQHLAEAVSRGDLRQMGKELEAVKQNIGQQYALADYLADHGEPEMQAHLHNVANAARQDIGNMFAEVEYAARQAVIDPANSKLLAALQANSKGLQSACARLVENMSVATPNQVLSRHQELAGHQRSLLEAVMAGDKQQMVNAMRAIRKTLNDELALAKAIARATNNPELRDRLEAVCANAQRQIDSLMGQLGDLAEMALSDPSNEELRQRLQGVLGEAQAVSAQLVAACGEDLLIESNRLLGDQLAELRDAMEVPDARAAVGALKAILGETSKQNDIARMIAENEGDEERATRITGYADALAAAAPVLVNATKARLGDFGNPLLSNEMQKAAMKVRDASAALLSAATLDANEEYLANAARLDADMQKMLHGVELGLAPDVESVADLVKKVSAQVKLGASIANKMGDGKKKQSLINAGAAMSKLMGLMVAAVKEGVDKDPKNMEKFAGFLRDAIAMNRGTVADAFGVEDDLNAVTDEINMNIAQLEKALDHGTVSQLNTALAKVQGGVAQQAFLAKILASKAEDPERKRALLEAVDTLEGVSTQLGPTLLHAKLNPKDAASQRKALAAIDSLKEGVQAVSNAGSGGTEGMADRAIALAQQMDVLENAVKANNAPLANQALGSVSSGLRQQAQLARATATATQDPQAKAAILAYADGLEKSIPIIQGLVKDALAKPNDKALQQKLSAALASARAQMAGATAALTPAHIQPVDSVNATAQGMKKEIAELRAAIQSSDPKAGADALAATKRGAYAQQLELAKAYATTIQDPVQRLAVGEAISELDKILRDFLPAVANAQEKPRDKATVQKVVPPADAALAALNSVLAASSVSADDRVLSAATAAAVLMSQVENDLRTGADPSHDLAALKPAIAQASKAIRAAAADAVGEKKGKLYALADKVDAASPELAKLAQSAHAHKDPASLQAFATLAAETRDTLGKAVALAAPASGQEQAAKIAAHTAAQIDSLTAALASADRPSADRALAQLRGPVQEQLVFNKDLAELTGDPNVIASANKAATLAPQLVTAAVGAIKNPADKNQRQKVQQLADETKQALAETVAGYENADAMLVANADKLESSLNKLTASAKSGDTSTANAALDAAQSALSQQVLLARAVAHQAQTPEAKAAILKDAESAEKLVPELSSTAKAAIAKPSDAAAQQKLATVAAKTKDVNKSLANHGRSAQQQRIERARKAQQEREEKARRLLEEDSVETVSLVLNERTDKLKVDNTTEGKLYGTAKEISAALALLSKAAKSGDKKGMIEAARELTRASQLYVTQAAAAAEKCHEPILKEQILTNAQAAKNWSVQLKIIAAVKAASDEDTSVAKDQLLKCAKGVSKAVINTVNSVEIAAVHKK